MTPSSSRHTRAAVLALCFALAAIMTTDAQAGFFGGGRGPMMGGFRAGPMMSFRAPRGRTVGRQRGGYARGDHPIGSRRGQGYAMQQGGRHVGHRHHGLPIVVRSAAAATRAPNVPPPAAPVAPLITPPPRPAAAIVQDTRFVPDEVLFSMRRDDDAALAGLARRYRLTRIAAQRIDLIDRVLYRYRIADGRSVPNVVAALRADPQIAAVQPNFTFKLAGEPAQGARMIKAQYALDKLHLPQALELAQGERVLVAVIDSGVDMRHPEMAGAIADRFDAVGDGTQWEAHGTAIAGIIGARADLQGVAPRATLLAVRAFAESPAYPGAQGTSFHILTGLNWAWQHKARIVNMSFAGPQDPLLGEALAAAHDKGEILIAAAGNEGPGAAPAYPAADRNVIAVTATDRDDHVLAAANRGSYVALAAPGADIMVAAPGGAYTYTSGTSMAAAHVSGIAALLLSEKADLGADLVRGLLLKTAHGKPSLGDDLGAGLGDAFAAVEIVALAQKGGGTGLAELAVHPAVAVPKASSISAIR